MMKGPMEDALRSLREVGFAMLEPLSFFDRFLEHLLAHPVFVDAHVPQTARNRGDFHLTGRWEAEATRSECVCVPTETAIIAPGLLEWGLQHLDLASEYLGRDPAVSYSANAFWTRPGPAALRDDIQSFHVDQDDVRFLALFVYLSNVMEDADGPQDLEGPDGVRRTIYGPPGTVFMADTSRPHRGRKPTRGERGIAWWRYGVSDRPPANEWDKIEPIPAAAIGRRYPSNPKHQESIRLLVTQSESQ